jgi:hypothetical protein
MAHEGLCAGSFLLTYYTDVVGESGCRFEPSKVRLTRCRPWNFPDPMHEPLKINRHRCGQMMKMGLSQTPIPCPLHAQGKSGLGYGPFDAGSPFVVCFKTLCVLALASRLERQMLRFGMERQTASCGCAPGTSLPHTTRSTILAIKRDLEGRLAAGSLRPNIPLSYRCVGALTCTTLRWTGGQSLHWHCPLPCFCPEARPHDSPSSAPRCQRRDRRGLP